MKHYLSKILLFPILLVLVVSFAGIEFTIHQCSADNSNEIFLFQTNPSCHHESSCEHEGNTANDELEVHAEGCCHTKQLVNHQCCHNIHKVLKIEEEYLPSIIENSLKRIQSAIAFYILVPSRNLLAVHNIFIFDSLYCYKTAARVPQAFYCCFLI